MYVSKVVAAVIASFSCILASALAGDTYSYDEYIATKTWSYTGDNAKWEVAHAKQTGVTEGKTFVPPNKYPPYYKFQLTGGKPSWIYQKYIYHQGFQQDLVTCKEGDWMDTYLDYNKGPDFLKQYPKEAWTVCLVGSDGGLGGGYYWYLFFVNVKKDSGSGGGDICTSKCLLANNQQYGYATPPKTPPCWQKEAAGYYSCYNYNNQGKCPWGGMTDCTGQGGSTTPPTTTTAPPTGTCSGQCLVANYQPYGYKSGADAPPCWQKEAAGYYSCFDYAPGTKNCPWGGMTDCKK